MSQYTNSSFIDFSFLEDGKYLRTSQSVEDLSHLEFPAPLPMRKRIWSSDYLLMNDNSNMNNGFLDSLVNEDPASTPCSSQRGACQFNKSKKKATREDFVTKFKTEMCKHWEDKGSCPFGKRCAFAHGDQDKRFKAMLKEKRVPIKCVNFHQHGYCAYGRRCQFLHFSNVVPVTKTSQCYQDKLNDPVLLEMDPKEFVCTGRPRLGTFELITTTSAGSAECHGENH